MTKNANQKKALEIENKPHPTDVLIKEELDRWEKLSIMPFGTLPQLIGQVPGVPVDVLKMDVMFTTLIESLIEQLGLDKDKVNEKFKENYLNKLRTIREESELERQRPQVMVPRAEVPQLIIPDNIRKKMH